MSSSSLSPSFLALSVGASPSPKPFTPAPCQLLFGCGTLFGIHTHLKGTRQGQFLSTPGVFSALGRGDEAAIGGGGGFFGLATSSSQREHLANHRFLVERNGSTATSVNVPIVTD